MSATGVFRQLGGIGNATGWAPKRPFSSGGRSTEIGVNRCARNGSPRTPQTVILAKGTSLLLGTNRNAAEIRNWRTEKPCGRKLDSVPRCPFERSKFSGVTTRSSQSHPARVPYGPAFNKTPLQALNRSSCVQSFVWSGHHGSIRARQRMLACIILSWLTTWQSSAWPASRSNA
jgi:hypothetical protein